LETARLTAPLHSADNLPRSDLRRRRSALPW